MNNRALFLSMLLCGIILIGSEGSFAQQKPYRVGTTAGNFLEVGYGGAAVGMGDAYVSVGNDLNALYWNPASLALMEKNQALFSYQPWIAGINSSYAAAAIVMPSIGTLGAQLIVMDYGEMDVTTMAMQEGTGEKFTASDYAFGISFSRRLADWFSFGATGKYIISKIWHTDASAMAVDMGVLINTGFFSPTGNNIDGMNIGMSISNYGTHLKYDGMDLMNPIDILPDEHGNYGRVQGKYDLQDWELPLIFRVGVSVNPIMTTEHKFTVAVDALHPNNNSESVNVGAQYSYTLPSFGQIFIRGGYKALFMADSQYGLTLGFGINVNLFDNNSLKIDYGYRQIGILGNTHSYGISFSF